MDINTQQVKEGIEQIAVLLSELVVKCAKEGEGVGIGEIEAGMRRMLQDVGRQAMAHVLEKSDTVTSSI
jgi:hypothetical protein